MTKQTTPPEVPKAGGIVIPAIGAAPNATAIAWPTDQPTPEEKAALVTTPSADQLPPAELALGMLLRDARAERGYSLSEVANLVGCTKPHLWELETSRTGNPRAELVWRLAECLAIATDDICRWAWRKS